MEEEDKEEDKVEEVDAEEIGSLEC